MFNHHVTAGVTRGIVYISPFQLHKGDVNSSFNKGTFLFAMTPQHFILYHQTFQTSVSQNSTTKKSAKSKKGLVRTPNRSKCIRWKICQSHTTIGVWPQNPRIGCVQSRAPVYPAMLYAREFNWLKQHTNIIIAQGRISVMKEADKRKKKPSKGPMYGSKGWKAKIGSKAVTWTEIFFTYHFDGQPISPARHLRLNMNKKGKCSERTAVSWQLSVTPYVMY